MSNFDLTEWLKALGPYQTIFVLAALVPSMTSWGMPSGATEYLNPAYISLAVALIGFFASKHNFSGPLRYGIAKYGPSLQGLYKKTPDGTIWILLLLRTIVPWTQTWLVALLSIGWQYTLQHFREAVRVVATDAQNLCARASIAAAQAETDVVTVARYEADALASGAAAARDMREATGIRASDFFQAAASAFSAVESSTEAIEQAQSHSANAMHEAERAKSTYSTSAASNYLNYTNNAANSVDVACGRARAAVNIISDFRIARDGDATARYNIKVENERVAKAVRVLLDKSSTLPAEVVKLAKAAQAVRHKTSQAIGKAEEGRTKEATTLTQEATTEVANVEAEAKRIAGVKAEIRSLLLTQVLGPV